MAQPVFSLQAVLDVRHSRVEALEIALGKLLAEERAGREKQALLREQQTELLQKMSSAMSDEMDIIQLDLLRRNLLANEIESAHVQTVLNDIARLITIKRNELLKAHTDEEVLVTLKDQREEVFRNEQKAKEASQQSDVYIAQSFRQRSAAMHSR